MRGDITIYIAPCDADENHKKYNKSILEVMENSKMEYEIHVPPNRLQGLIKIEVKIEEDPTKYSSIAKNLKSKLENQGINIKKILDFRGKPL